MLAMFSADDQYPLGVVGVPTGIKHKARNIYIGDTVVFRSKNGTFSKGLVLLAGTKVVVELTAGRLLSECNIVGIEKSYKDMRSGEVSDSRGVIFLKVTV